MAKALLIAGDGVSLLGSVELMEDFLLDEADVKDIAVVRTAYLTFQEFQDKLVSAIDAARNEPLLIVFSGHGGRAGKGNGIKSGLKMRKKRSAGWQLSSDRQVFSYYELACLLKDHPAPLYIVNECCFAFGIVRELRRAGISPKRCGVLAASAGNRYSYGGLIKEILNHWRKYQPLLSQGIVRERNTRLIKHLSFKEKFADLFLRPLNHAVYTISEDVFLKISSFLPMPYADKKDPVFWETSKIKKRVIRAQEKRWGVFFDYFFFPVKTKEEGTVCCPQVITVDE